MIGARRERRESLHHVFGGLASVLGVETGGDI